MTTAGLVVVLNGVPRSGKSTLAVEIMRSFDGEWRNLGVDSVVASTPTDMLPGIGLRPGGERPDLEPFVRESYSALFDAIVAECLAGRNVVVDVGIHEGYSQPLGIWDLLRQRLGSVDMLSVAVHCSLGALRRRRAASGYLSWDRDADVPEPVLLWQQAVHADKTYDIEVDTSTTSTADLAAVISQALPR